MISLLEHGQPAQCRIAVTELDLFVHQLRIAAEVLDAALRTVGNNWTGIAADDFRSQLTGIAGDAEELHHKAAKLLGALEVFAWELDLVHAELDRARNEALAGGLLVQGDVIQPPPTLTTDLGAPAPVYGPVPTSLSFDQRIDRYWQCNDLVTAARAREQRAHDDLQAAAGAVLREPFLEHWLGKLGLLPSYPGGQGLWAGNATLFGAGATADWATKAKYGEFTPSVGGTRVPAENTTAWQRFSTSFRSTSWTAKRGMEVPHARWATTGKAFGVAGGVVAGGTAAWSQWRADADDPSVGDTEQVARSATTGVATGVGAYAGALGGAQLGGAIGTAICPGAGTVIGAAIGGTVLGLAGSQVGAEIGDITKGVVGDTAGVIAGGVKAAKFW